jgi:hypothetical protein
MEMGKNAGKKGRHLILHFQVDSVIQKYVYEIRIYVKHEDR